MQRLLVAALAVLTLGTLPRLAEAGSDCSVSYRTYFPTCGHFHRGSRGWWIFRTYWWQVDNDCPWPMEVKIDFMTTWDVQFVLLPMQGRRQDPAHGATVSDIDTVPDPTTIYCCANNPETACSEAEAEQKGILAKPAPKPTE